MLAYGKVIILNKYNVDKNILHKLIFDRTPNLNFNINDLTTRYEYNISTEVAETVNAEIYDLMYRVYCETNCNELILLDKNEFKKFIDKCLPDYIRLIKAEQMNEKLTAELNETKIELKRLLAYSRGYDYKEDLIDE